MTIEHLDRLWESLAGAIATAMRMSGAETERFQSNTIAKLIGLLPFIANCDDPERTSLSHLATFVVAGRGESRHVFDHGPADDVEPLARLRTISDFKGGDDATIERGMALLCLCMLSGYERDADEDARTGEYNPINAGSWNAVSLQTELIRTISERPSASLDALMTLEEARILLWES
jgi:hypothetical protein